MVLPLFEPEEGVWPMTKSKYANQSNPATPIDGYLSKLPADQA
jgi:hypothetical protein